MPSRTKTVTKAQPAYLPKVPVSSRPQSATDEFWLQQGTSGAINAFRQLSYTKHKNGRKQITLPGGKLQPLFKNYSAPAGLGTSRPKILESDVLPGIASTSSGVLDEAMKEVIAGNLCNLPECQPTTVRVYLASNEKDMKAEREVIMKKAVPDIQNYCAEEGLHFQMVDMPWSEATDTITSEIHQKEITRCQNVSIAPNFVVLVGDMNGPLLPPNILPEDVYNALVTTGMENSVENIEVLQECFGLDSLALVPQYVLKNDLTTSTLQDLVRVLRAVQRAAQGKNDEMFSNILKSGLERDIMQGVTNTKDPRNYCLCFRREWQNMDYSSEDVLQNYVDTVPDDDDKPALDSNAHNGIQSLTNKLMQHLGVGNCRQYFLNHEEYMEGKTKEYEEYLENLQKHFASDMKHMIKQGLERQRHGKLLTVYNEALHHAHVCSNYLTYFQGQQELLFTVEKFLKDPRRNFRPFVIHGETGSGKSATLAKVASSVKSWFTQDCVVVTRFLGTTYSSSGIHQSLASITQQICAAYGITLPQSNTTLFDAVTTYRKVIETVSEKFAGIRPLIIVLDGIDQLMPIEDSMKALWSICQMPSNVHIIMSTVTQMGQLNLAGMLSTMVTDPDSVQLVEPLSRTDVTNLIDSIAAGMDKKVTEDFRHGLLDSCKLLGHLQDPLFVHHSVDIALRTSSQNLDAENASDILAAALEQMEEKYHPSLMKYISSYLTINPLGIQERELLDLLNSDTSLTSVVSQEKSWLLTDTGITTYAWAQIKHDLSSFIRDNRICERVVLAWNHRTWFAAVANMYGVIYPGIDESLISAESTTFTLELHKNMENLYLANCNESSSVIPNSPQPTERQNVMKLVKLPQHMHVLLPVDGLQNVKNNMFFNLQWLLAKLRAFSIHDILNDLQSAIELAKQFGDEMDLDQTENTVEDMQAMYEFLQRSQEGLQQNPNNLPAEIMARLPALLSKYPALNNLVNSVGDFVAATSDPCLMPVYPCLVIPNSPLRHTLDGPTHVVGLIQEDTLVVTFSQTSGVGIWRLETGELIHRFPVNAEQSVNGILPTKSGEHVLIGHYSHIKHVMDLEVYSISTGICLISAQFPQKFELMKLDALDEILLVSTTMEVAGNSKKQQRCLLGIDIRSKEIAYTIPVTANDVHKHGISEIMFLQDSLDVLTVGNKLSQDLACWNLESQELKWKVKLEHQAKFVEIASDKIVVASPESGVLTVINSESGDTIVSASDPKVSGAEDVYLSKQGKHLILGSGATGLTVMDLKSATSSKTIELNVDDGIEKVSKINMDPTEQFIFVAYVRGAIDVISIMKCDRMSRLVGHSQEVTSLVCAELDSKLLSASKGGSWCVWNLMSIAETYHKKTGDNNQKSFDGIEQFSSTDGKSGEGIDVSSDNHYQPSQDECVSDLCLVSSKQFAVTSSTSKAIKIWDITTGNQVALLENTVGTSKVYSAYKDKLLLAHTSVPGSSFTRNLSAWNFGTFDKVKTDNNILIYTSCLLPDGDRIFTISPNTEGDKQGIMLGIYDLFEMRQVASLHCNIYEEMNASNLELLGVSTVKKPRPADVASEQEADLETAYHAVLDYSPNENISYFFTFVISGEQLSMDHIDPVYINTHSPSCTKLLKDGVVASGTLDGTIVLWTVEEHDITGYLSDPSMRRKSQKEGVLPSAAHTGKLTCLSVDGDNKKLASVCMDGSAKVWDLVTCAHTNTFNVSTNPLRTCDISCDGSLVVVGGEDKQITILSTISCTKLASFYSYGHITKIYLSNDKQIVAKCDDSNGKLIMLKAINVDAQEK